MAAIPLAMPQVGAAHDAARAIGVLKRALRPDPAFAWMYPDPGQYEAHFEPFVRAVAQASFESGTALRAGDYAGTALWMPPGTASDEGAFRQVIERSVAPAQRREVEEFFAQMREEHPAEPHWYLPFIGVDPGMQGRGLESALLDHALGQSDRDGLPAYLEATTLASARFYERHGFEIVGTVQAGWSPPVFPMVRRPVRRFWRLRR